MPARAAPLPFMPALVCLNEAGIAYDQGRQRQPDGRFQHHMRVRHTMVVQSSPSEGHQLWWRCTDGGLECACGVWT